MDARIPQGETIAALATPMGQGGIGIVRLSGSQALSIAERIFRPHRGRGPLETHRLYLGWIEDPASGHVLDQVLLSIMRAPHSYTREDVVEINSHSGYLLLSRILDLVFSQGARPANPGEFTLRAFLNGRIDLTQAEAVVDLVQSKSERALLCASGQIQGRLRDAVTRLRDCARSLLAHAEVAIDFPEDESDIFSRKAAVQEITQGLLAPVSRLMEAHRGSRVWTEGVQVVLTGRVNAGKSSLLNALVHEARALVTPIEGTTRDVIEVPLNLRGIPLRLMDTAGFGTSADTLDRLGMELSERSLRTADLVLLVVDQSRAIEEEDLRVLRSVSREKVILVLNKGDLPSGITEEERVAAFGGLPFVVLSALNGEGIPRLEEELRAKVLASEQASNLGDIAPNFRHAKALEEAGRAFGEALGLAREEAPLDLLAFELRAGLEALGEITGENQGEAVLEEIFSRFCLGK